MQRVYQTEVQHVNDLMQCLIDVWAGVKQSIIDDATDQQHRHLHVCIRATGYFEYSP